MTLADWLAQKGVTQAGFAASVGVQPAAVSKWLRRRTRPDWATLDRIVAATGGAVTANDFHDAAIPGAAQPEEIEAIERLLGSPNASQAPAPSPEEIAA